MTTSDNNNSHCHIPLSDAPVDVHNNDENNDNFNIMNPLQSSASSDTTITTTSVKTRPRKTIYMDGIFDLFHIGHLSAIRQASILGDKLIIGITSDSDATSYKRAPIISQQERIEIVSSIKGVDYVICPCPLVVTEEFCDDYGIDLVVHGFASEEDERRQYEFFKEVIRLGKFMKIPYYSGQSTTEILNKIRAMDIENDKEDDVDEDTEEGNDGDIDKNIEEDDNC